MYVSSRRPDGQLYGRPSASSRSPLPVHASFTVQRQSCGSGGGGSFLDISHGTDDDLLSRGSVRFVRGERGRSGDGEEELQYRSSQAQGSGTQRGDGTIHITVRKVIKTHTKNKPKKTPTNVCIGIMDIISDDGASSISGIITHSYTLQQMQNGLRHLLFQVTIIILVDSFMFRMSGYSL